MISLSARLERELNIRGRQPQSVDRTSIPIEVYSKTERARKKAEFVLREHGRPIGDPPSQLWLQPVGLSLPDGQAIEMYLMGHFPKNSHGNSSDPLERIEYLTEIHNSGDKVMLFEFTPLGPRWWDGRRLTEDDSTLIGDLVGEVYNTTFVPAGQ